MMGNTGMRTVVFALAVLGIAGCTTAPKKDVVDTIASTGSHNTLVQAIKAAGLESTLRDKGPFTVMAPTDEAFALLPKGTLDSLLKPENKAQLTKVLQYHVVPGNNPSSKLVPTPPPGNATNVAMFNNNTPVKTAAGSDITVGQWEGSVDGVWVNAFSKVTKPNIQATNGVVHSVDRVLLPR
jgi:uncharacterized surface protein with fasciclin (FAS1) repeats